MPVRHGFPLLAGLLLCIVAPLPAASAPFETYYRYPADHQAFQPDARLRVPPRLVARYGLVNVGVHTASKSSPVRAGDAVFVGADSGHLYALDADDLALRWAFRVRPEAGFGIHGTPAVVGDRVYIGAYDGYLYVLDRQSGRLLEQRRLGDYIGASPVTWEGRLYIATETRRPDGKLVCVDPETFEYCFRPVLLGGHAHSTPTIDAATRTVFVGANSEWFHAIDADTGAVRWKHRTGGDIKSTAAVAGGLVVVSSWDKQAWAFDTRSGAVRWTFSTGRRSMSSPAIDPERRRVYFGSHDRHLYALDLDTGEQVWSFRTGRRILSSPVIAGAADGRRLVVFGSHDGRLYWLDAATGTLVHRFETQGAVSGVAHVAGDRLYVSGDDGFLYFFR